MKQEFDVERYDECIRMAYAAAAGNALFDRLREALQRYLQADAVHLWSAHSASDSPAHDSARVGSAWPSSIQHVLTMPPYEIAIDGKPAALESLGVDASNAGTARRVPAGHRAACWFDIAEGWRGVLMMMNESGSGPLGEHQIARMRRITPHVRDALNVGLDLQQSRAIRRSVGALLSRCQGALFVCERDGLIVGSTPAAEAVFDQFREHVQRVDGRIMLTSCDVNQRLHRLLDDPGHTDGRAIPVCTPPGDGADSLSCIVMPLELPLVTSSGNYALRSVVLFQPDQVGAIDRAYLQTRFEITRAEADILALLMEGHSVEAVALRRHSTINTIRSYVKGLRQKMDCRTQAQLVAKGWRNMPFASRPALGDIPKAIPTDALVDMAAQRGSTRSPNPHRQAGYS